MKFFRGNDIVFWRWRLFFSFLFFYKIKYTSLQLDVFFFLCLLYKVIKNATCSIYKSIKH